MPKPGNPLSNPFTAPKKAAVGSAAEKVVSGDLAGTDAGNLTKPERPVLTPQLRGISAVGTQDRLPRLSLRKASTVSAILHLIGPFVLTLLILIGLWVFALIMHLNFWDFFKPKPPQDTTFTLVDETHAKRPEHPLFKGNANQEAGGKHQKQPLNPDKNTAVTPPKAKAEKPAAPPKPQPKPTQKAQAPQPAQKPVPETPKPEAQKPVPVQKPPQPTENPTVAKPLKAEKPAPPKADRPQPKAQTAKAAAAANAPEPVQVSTHSTDFGISTSPPAKATAGNPQEGKAKEAGVDVAQDVDYGPFMADLKKRINRNWVPPRGMESRKLVLLFYLRHDGQVVKVEIQKSSGDQEADQAAVEAVKVSAPFMALPPQIKEDILPVEFTFDYNVLNSKNAKQALKW